MPMNSAQRLGHFYVGQKVRVRQWDDMKSQYGASSTGSIQCQSVFVNEMEAYCGHEFTIEKIHPRGTVEFVGPEGSQWNWSLDMIEDIEEEPDFVLSDNSMEAFII